MLALPGILQLFSLWSQWRLHRRPNQELRKFMNVERPDVVIHPTVLDGVYINDLTEACRSHLVPLVAIINSWDNPSTKNAVIGAPDWLLVWGPQTKAHAIQFLSMPDDRVLEFGAAQFDVYRNPARINRDEFCRLHDIERASQILLYAGSSKATDEFQHLALLDAAIERGELGNVTVVYRPHPWGAAGKGGARIVGATWRHVRIESTMRGYMAGVAAGRRGISLPDYRDTHDVLSAIDALMSPLSTIILEGALHGKAVACFLPDDDDPTGHFNLALPMMHFSDLFTEPAFVVARGTTELVDAARRTLERSRDPTTAAEVRSAARYFSASFDEPYSRRLLDFVEGLRTAMDAKVKGGEACRFD